MGMRQAPTPTIRPDSSFSFSPINPIRRRLTNTLAILTIISSCVMNSILSGRQYGRIMVQRISISQRTLLRHSIFRLVSVFTSLTRIRETLSSSSMLGGASDEDIQVGNLPGRLSIHWSSGGHISRDIMLARE